MGGAIEAESKVGKGTTFRVTLDLPAAGDDAETEEHTETAKHIPIIALTANAYHEDIQKCLAAGMNAHLSKPINIDRAVRTIIECARTAKENGQKKKAHESNAFVSLFAIFTACRRQISKFDSHRSGCASRR